MRNAYRDGKKYKNGKLSYANIRAAIFKDFYSLYTHINRTVEKWLSVVSLISL